MLLHQRLDVISRQELAPVVLVLQTDAGPDHSMKRMKTKLALIALFKKLDLDHLFILRGAPNGSAFNKIERAMSPLNIALSNTATKRAAMPGWAEDAVKNCGSMDDIRKRNEVMKELQRRAAARVAQLDEKQRNKALGGVVRRLLWIWETTWRSHEAILLHNRLQVPNAPKQRKCYPVTSVRSGIKPSVFLLRRLGNAFQGCQWEGDQ